MITTFDHTVNILVQAYLNDTLVHKFCTACAVGNLVGAAMSTSPARSPDLKFDCWKYENGEIASWYNFVVAGCYSDDAFRQIASTGYSLQNLKDIEYAFESAPGDPCACGGGLTIERITDPTWMFNGLMAVVDVLAQIHKIDLSTKDKAKALFIK